MLSLVSGGVTGFYDALEKVLVWLTQAEHNLSVLAGLQKSYYYYIIVT